MGFKKVKRFVSAKKWSKRRKRTVLVRFCIGFIAVSVFYILYLPDVRSLKSASPKASALIEDRQNTGSVPQNFTLEWTPLSKISPSLQRAVIVAEDGNFYRHRGVDYAELMNALQDAWMNLSFPRGASTITQQLAKNLYLSESYNPLRKIKEILIAKRLERQLGKKRILELYLNVIEWGEGIFGITAASRHYFGIQPNALSESQSAFLAAIIPNPRTTFNPSQHPKRVERRKQLILRRM